MKGRLHLIEEDLGEGGLEWASFEQLDNFMRLRAEWVVYCLERGIEP